MVGPIAIQSRSRPLAVPVVRFVLAAALVVLTCGPGFAIDSQRTLTQALLRKWQTQQGLPHPTITVITQAADGTLWLGTQAGLYSFDGVRFESALVSGGPSLDELWINDLCEDADGRLWIASRSGLLSWQRGEVEDHGLPLGTFLRRANCLMIDGSGQLWAGGDGGIAVYDRGTFRRYAGSDGLNIPSVRDIAEASDRRIWVGGDGAGLAVFKDQGFSDVPSAAGSVVNALLADSNGSMVVGTNRGLVRIDPQGVATRLAAKSDLGDETFECLARTGDGVLWAGTRSGLCRLHGDDFESLGTRDGLTQSTVLTIFEDQEGSLWVGTKHGLNQLTDRKTLPLTMSEGLLTNEAGPIVQDAAGQIWIGTLGEGLAKYDGRRCVVVANRQPKLPSRTLLSMAASEDGLWAGTKLGVFLWRDGQIVTKLGRAEGLPHNEVSCLAIDGAGGVWIGTPRGLVRFDGESVETPTDDPAVSKSSVYALHDTGSRGVLASTSNGVFLIHEGQAMRLPGDEAWLRDVHAIDLGPEGEFWLASRGRGLMLVNGEEVAYFTVADGLFDDEIVGIERSDDDELWMGCSRGVFSISRKSLLEFARGSREEQLTFFSLSPTEAQRTVECQRNVQPAVSRTANGDIWFSTIHGVIAVSPDKLKPPFAPQRPVVTRLMVNGQPIFPAEQIVVPPSSLNLSIRYTSNSLSWPSRTQFRYQLEGFDSEWIYAGTRRDAFYTNLGPGTYTFRLSASGIDPTWIDLPAPVQVTLRAAFWQTSWFPLLVSAMVLGAVWLILRLRVLRVRTRMNAIVSERARIARELHDTLIQGFSGVTMQMQAVSAKVGDPEIRRTINEVISDAGACLREARQSVAGLRNSLGTSMGLAAALEQTARQLTETRDVRLQLELPDSTPNLPVEVQFNLLRIAQEAITNATRHSNARTIDVALTPKPGRLALRVHDDGVGFAVPDRETPDQRHYGLIGMRERSRQISADLTIESKPGAGTTILVDLPLNGAEQNGAATLPSTYNPSKTP